MEDCNAAVSRTFRGHDGLREFRTSYRKTFDEMKSEFRNIVADDTGYACLEWTTEGTSDSNTVSYQGVSILEIQDGRVKRFMAYEQIVDL